MQGSPTENDEPEMTPENKNVAEFHQDFMGQKVVVITLMCKKIGLTKCQGVV